MNRTQKRKIQEIRGQGPVGIATMISQPTPQTHRAFRSELCSPKNANAVSFQQWPVSLVDKKSIAACSVLRLRDSHRFSTRVE